MLSEETSGNRHATIIMKRVALTTSTKLELVIQSFFSLTKQPTLVFVIDAMQSHGPFSN
jgi:hypothetical protein